MPPTDILRLMQLASGALWLFPLALFMPAVFRVWFAPSSGPRRPDPLDVLVSPLAFIAALQVGFIVRWIIYPDAIAVMSVDELMLWAGLYSLSAMAAVLSAFAWRIARGLR